MDDIELVDYDPRWPALFAEEEKRLRSVLDPASIAGLEHFGSTAIPGMSAKPIIDILIAVRSLAEARRSYVAPLQGLGYVYWAENPKTDRMFFVKGMPPFGAGGRIMSTSPNARARCGRGWPSAIICALTRMKPCGTKA